MDNGGKYVKKKNKIGITAHKTELNLKLKL